MIATESKKVDDSTSPSCVLGFSNPEQTIFDQMWVPKMRPLSGHKSGTTAGAPTVGAPALVPKLRPFFGAPLLLEKLKPSALVLITTHNTQLEKNLVGGQTGNLCIPSKTAL